MRIFRRTFFPSTRMGLVALIGAAGLAMGSEPAEAGRGHWSFLPIRPVNVPVVENRSDVITPVDPFIIRQLAGKNLSLAKPAGLRELIRRVSFDVTGLPPAPEEIAAFLRDAIPDPDGAYERLVDRLLASHHYGERWGQHWLDVVRYAESEGFEYDRHLPDGWRFRDYVIRSHNEDKPFDLFIREQLAGDEMAPGYRDAQIAAGFHRLGAVRRNAGNPEIALSRNEVLTERTDIIGVAFLGLTVGCARCHDHKLDPISHRDYYRLQAYLAASQEYDMPLVPGQDQAAWQKKTKGAKSAIARLKKNLATASADKAVNLQREIDRLTRRLPPQPPAITSIRNDADQRTAIHVLKRGDWELKGDPVGLRPLSALVDETEPELPAETGRPRSRLADWLLLRDNPLTARVIVNRLWQHHFGAGIVKTANDFGRHGGRPSHPELLDFLATELIRGGWRLKPLHRMILLSRTYRQSSVDVESEQGGLIDPENRLLSRFSRRRLEAEQIRDAMLAVSGELNRKALGASVMPPVDEELIALLYKPDQWVVTPDPAEHHRRSVYLMAKRNLRLPFLEVFDQPARQASCARRVSGTHAPQALELLNGDTANARAAAFAVRLRREAGEDPGAQIERAFFLVTGRGPSRRERDLAVEFRRGQSLREFALAMFNLNAFLYVQ